MERIGANAPQILSRLSGTVKLYIPWCPDVRTLHWPFCNFFFKEGPLGEMYGDSADFILVQIGTATFGRMMMKVALDGWNSFCLDYPFWGKIINLAI